jgi:hypothetical protein
MIMVSQPNPKYVMMLNFSKPLPNTNDNIQNYMKDLKFRKMKMKKKQKMKMKQKNRKLPRLVPTIPKKQNPKAEQLKSTEKITRLETGEIKLN